MLGEVTHLQTILEDLTNLTAEPNKLPPASEQVPSSPSLLISQFFSSTLCRPNITFLVLLLCFPQIWILCGGRLSSTNILIAKCCDKLTVALVLQPW